MLISLKMRLLVLSLVALPFTLQCVYAEAPLVFITAFAPAEEGAIHAYHMNPNSGQLTLAHKTTDVEHPFFIAISPDAINAYAGPDRPPMTSVDVSIDVVRRNGTHFLMKFDGFL